MRMTYLFFSFVSSSYADEALKRTACSGHLECSALTQSNLRPVFDTAIKCGIDGVQQKSTQSSRFISFIHFIVFCL